MQCGCIHIAVVFIIFYDTRTRHFVGFGFGARGENYYEVSLDLFGKIDVEVCEHCCFVQPLF